MRRARATSAGADEAAERTLCAILRRYHPSEGMRRAVEQVDLAQIDDVLEVYAALRAGDPLGDTPQSYTRTSAIALRRDPTGWDRSVLVPRDNAAALT